MKKEYLPVIFTNYTEKSIKFVMEFCYDDGNKLKVLFAPKSLLKNRELPVWFLNKAFKQNRRGAYAWGVIPHEDDEMSEFCHIDFLGKL